MAESYRIQALNLYDSFNIKTIRTFLAGRVIHSSPQELVVQHSDTSFQFFYRFGCVVFFNFSSAEIDAQVQKLTSNLGQGLENPTAESYEVLVGDTHNHVEFEYVELKKLTAEYLRLIAMTVGQSAALEYFESIADRMLLDTSTLMQALAQKGVIPFRGKELVKRIGTAASARQSIISKLSVLDPPEETWKSKELEKLYTDTQQNFDIQVRFRTLDRKLSLIQDNIEILADLASRRRANFLEALLIFLIVLEVVLAVLSALK